MPYFRFFLAAAFLAGDFLVSFLLGTVLAAFLLAVFLAADVPVPAPFFAADSSGLNSQMVLSTQQMITLILESPASFISVFNTKKQTEKSK